MGFNSGFKGLISVPSVLSVLKGEAFAALTYTYKEMTIHTIKPTQALMLKLYSLHTICHNKLCVKM